MTAIAIIAALGALVLGPAIVALLTDGFVADAFERPTRARRR